MTEDNGQAWPLVVDELSEAALPRPPGWRRVDDPAAVIVLVEPYTPEIARQRAFRANASLILEQPHELLRDLAAFTTRMVDNLLLTLTDAHVIDIEPVDLAGREGRRLLCGYRSGKYALALEQWWTVIGETGVTLSGTCAVEDYLRASPIFEVLAAGLVLPSQVAS